MTEAPRRPPFPGILGSYKAFIHLPQRTCLKIMRERGPYASCIAAEVVRSCRILESATICAKVAKFDTIKDTFRKWSSRGPAPRSNLGSPPRQRSRRHHPQRALTEITCPVMWIMIVDHSNAAGHKRICLRHGSSDESAGEWAPFVDDKAHPAPDLLVAGRKVIASALSVTCIYHPARSIFGGVTYLWNVAFKMDEDLLCGVATNLSARRNVLRIPKTLPLWDGETQSRLAWPRP
ncbi:hypothetical protein F5148DRAFT_1356611 [Russula earlei]|uniref:Uncharacterized protein n=1 Tax=Russula earlei TaxID=71964 RepID=A0ACC0U967_9AGAM|nr:hypothetical protein F5148DRAFT_1356611 [Russula earlei]